MIWHISRLHGSSTSTPTGNIISPLIKPLSDKDSGHYGNPNVVSMTRVLQELVDAGYIVTPEIIARLSPYKTEHINRFGHYELRFDHVPPPVTEELRLSPASTEVGVIC